MNSLELSPQPFNVEQYRGFVVDIVHIQSLLRVVEGKKVADQSEVNAARVILTRIKQLQQSGIEVRLIDALDRWQPTQTPIGDKALIIGGAFEGECLAEYQKTLTDAGIRHRLDPLLTLRSGL